MRLGILGSTRGSNLKALVDAIAVGKLKADIALVISNREEALILQNARLWGLKTQLLPSKGLSREDYDLRLSQALEAAGVDWVVLIGYMRILSKQFIEQWRHRVINVHPSLLPAHAGLMDLRVHEAVLQAKEAISGCTVHQVTEVVDAGPILVQKHCPVLATDTAETLKARVQTLEGEALVEAIQILDKQVKA